MTDMREKIGKVTMDRVTQLLSELKSGERSLLTLEQTHAEIGRAALQVLMEPTDAMIEALTAAIKSSGPIYEMNVEAAWQAAIKEAMKND